MYCQKCGNELTTEPSNYFSHCGAPQTAMAVAKAMAERAVSSSSSGCSSCSSCGGCGGCGGCGD